MNKEAERDIVQFVPFKNFQDNPEELALEILKEIPYQFLSYFEKHRITPKKVSSEDQLVI